MNILDISKDIIATAQRPLDQAQTLPPQAYTDEAWFTHEAEHILRAGWLCAGHVSQLKQPGATLPLDLLGEPVMLVRGNDDEMCIRDRSWPACSSSVSSAWRPIRPCVSCTAVCSGTCKHDRSRPCLLYTSRCV